MNKVYAVVLEEHSFLGEVSRTNLQRPYEINDMNDYRKLETQFPEAWIVLGPQEFLLSGGFDLCDEDFEVPPLIPTGTPPTVLPFEEAIDNNLTLEICSADFYDSNAEEMILEDYPESETAKFILDTRKSIDEDGLRGMSGAYFDRGDVPFTFLRQRKNSLNTFERLAFEVNAMSKAIADGEGKPFKFNDSTKLHNNP
jgi:hypothetical protein